MRTEARTRRSDRKHPAFAHCNSEPACGAHAKGLRAGSHDCAALTGVVCGGAAIKVCDAAVAGPTGSVELDDRGTARGPGDRRGLTVIAHDGGRRRRELAGHADLPPVESGPVMLKPGSGVSAGLVAPAMAGQEPTSTTR